MAASADAAASPEYDVFVCHAGTEKRDVASVLVDELERRAPARVLRSAMALGTDADAEMDRAAEMVPVGVLVLSADFFQRKWPVKEAATFLRRWTAQPHAVKIIPFFYHLQPRAESLPTPWPGTAYQDGAKELYDKLSTVVGKVRTRPRQRHAGGARPRHCRRGRAVRPARGTT